MLKLYLCDDLQNMNVVLPVVVVEVVEVVVVAVLVVVVLVVVDVVVVVVVVVVDVVVEVVVVVVVVVVVDVVVVVVVVVVAVVDVEVVVEDLLVVVNISKSVINKMSKPAMIPTRKPRRIGDVDEQQHSDLSVKRCLSNYNIQIYSFNNIYKNLRCFTITAMSIVIIFIVIELISALKR